MPVGRRLFVAAGALLIGLSLGAVAWAQAPLTGSVRGRTVDVDGRPLQSVQVTARSTLLPSPRVDQTGRDGRFFLRGLPPGTYGITYAGEGLTTVERRVRIELGRVSRSDAVMEVAEFEEIIIILAEKPPAVETLESSDYQAFDAVDRLAFPHDLASIPRLGPLASDLVVRRDLGQTSIAGGLAWDSRVLIDGGEMNDPVLGVVGDPVTGLSVPVVTDTLEVVETLDGNLSAEYGRFTGGIVSALTRRGDDELHGSLRLDLSNPAWRARTPFESDRSATRPDDLQSVQSASIGGPLVKRRLQIFGAIQEGDQRQSSLFGLGGHRPTLVDDSRLQAKVTASPGAAHQLWGSIAAAKGTVVAASLPSTLDPAGLQESEVESSRVSLAWDGHFTWGLFGEARFSFHDSGVIVEAVDAGGVSTLPAFRATQEPGHYNAPWWNPLQPSTVDGVRLSGSIGRVLHGGVGGHELEGGFETSRDRGEGLGDPFRSNSALIADVLLTADGEAVRDPVGRLQPLFETGRTHRLDLIPAGDRVDVRSTALWVQDRWAALPKLALNLGLRVEGGEVMAPGALEAVKLEGQILPRVTVGWDIRGDGRAVLSAGYGRYGGRVNPTQVAELDAIRRSWTYVGPEGAGVDFAPGSDPGNWQPGGGSTPSRILTAGDDLQPALTDEMTITIAGQLGPIGWVELSAIQRSALRMPEDFSDVSLGTIERNGEVFDRALLDASSAARRDYHAAVLRAGIRFRKNWRAALQWSHEFEREGNYLGESELRPAAVSGLGDYEEMVFLGRSEPTGTLDRTARDLARLWSVWNQPLGPGILSISGLYTHSGGAAYSVKAYGFPLTAEQLASNPGYLAPPSQQTLFFDGRGSRRVPSWQTFDVALRWAFEFGRWEPWIEVEARNVFDDSAAREVASTVLPDPLGATDSQGLPVAYSTPAGIAQARRPEDYVTPREFRLSVGLSF